MVSHPRRSGLILLIWVLALALSAASTPAMDDIRSAIVPGLAVGADGETGAVNYIALQIAIGMPQDGPVIQFSEINFGGGSLVGEEWKTGVRLAIAAVLKELDLDGRDWVVTIKNRSYGSLTDGMSASGPIAVGILAAWRGETLRPDTAMTGQIEPDGKILPVGKVPQKVEAAAREQFTTVVVPARRPREDWDPAALADRFRVTVVEVETLTEAYRLMVNPAR